MKLQQPISPRDLIAELREYVDLRPRDVEMLRSLAPVIEPCLPELGQRFYDFIMQNHHVRSVLQGGGFDIEALKETWMEWARGLTSGRYDSEYAARRLRIGGVHMQAGVEVRYTQVAFNIVRQFLHDIVFNMEGHNPTRCSECLLAVNRILDLDMALICHAYGTELHAQTIALKNRERLGLEELFRGLLHAPNGLVLSLDSEGRITHFSRSCEQISGLAAAEVIGLRYTEVLAIPREMEKVEADIIRCFEPGAETGPRGIQGGGLKPYHLRTREGSERIVSWYPTSVHDSEGRVTEMLWVGHDITEETHLQERMLHQEKMSAVGLLAAGVAHEIGNPLASISSVAQTLQRKVNDRYVSEKLGLVLSHIDRITNIVRQMVSFARPPRYEWRPISTNQLIHNAIGILRYDKRARRVAIELNLEEDLPTTYAMEDQLTQVFMNVALNALDAVESLPESSSPTLKITARKCYTEIGSTILVIFEDNGPGIDAETATRIFEPFFTTKASGRGTGLGLSVSYRIVSEHGGRIQVDGRPGIGARFEVRIPIQTTPPEAA
ncbi:MAG: protoglobin domain-containing protein [Planctomycetota bacterium]